MPAEILVPETPDERRAELASILANGFLRLRARTLAREKEAAPREIPTPKKPLESSTF